jgi:large subunit ribosomal protein L4
MTIEAKRYSPAGEPLGVLTLPEKAFGQSVSTHVLWEATRCYLANQRQGTAKVKTRSEVAYSSRKPWRQKGTGRARSGTRGSPVWVGGGRAFGPKPRDYGYTLPRQVRRGAILGALSQKAAEGVVHVIDSIALPEPKTKLVAGILRAMGLEGKRCLLVLPETDATFVRCARNIPYVRTVQAASLSAYEIVDAEALVLSGDAVRRIEEVYVR